MPSKILNDDCWLAICDQLFGDFETLSRLMQVSHHFLALAGPKLYGQLSASQNSNTVADWSNMKRQRFNSLILFACGFEILSRGILVFECWADYKYFIPSPEQKLDKDCYQTTLFLPLSFTRPILFDYLGYLKRFTRLLMGKTCFDILMDTEVASIMETTNLLHESRCRLAKVLTDIDLYSLQDMEVWIDYTDQMRELDRLNIWIGDDCSNISKARMLVLKFVKDHKYSFPERKVKVVMKTGGTYELGLCLNFITGSRNIDSKGCWIEEQEELRIMSKQGQQEQDQLQSLVKSFSKVDFNNITTLKLNELSWDLRKQDVQNGFQNFVMRIKKFQRLENLKFSATNATSLPWHTIFSSESSKSTAMATKGQDQQQRGESFISRLQQFSGVGLNESTFFTVIDRFRNSLEKLSFAQDKYHRGGLNFLDSLEWVWPLSRLTVLKLEDAEFEMRKLEKLCPVLESLFLRNVVLPMQSQESGMVSIGSTLLNRQWKLPPRIKSLYLIRGHSMDIMDLDSMSRLFELKELWMEHDQDSNLDARFQINTCQDLNLLDFSFSKLETLTLGGNGQLIWIWQQKLLCAGINNLKSFRQNGWLMDGSILRNWWHVPLDLGIELCAGQLSSMWSENDIKVESKQDRIWDVWTTKIEKICFEALWDQDTDDVKLLKTLLETKKSTARMDSQKTIPTLSIPMLSHIKIDTRDDMTTYAYSRRTYISPQKTSKRVAKCIEQLVLVLMKRPRMKSIVMENWIPTPEFVKRRLEPVDQDQCPRSIIKANFGASLKNIHVVDEEEDEREAEELEEGMVTYYDSDDDRDDNYAIDGDELSNDEEENDEQLVEEQNRSRDRTEVESDDLHRGKHDGRQEDEDCVLSVYNIQRKTRFYILRKPKV